MAKDISVRGIARVRVRLRGVPESLNVGAKADLVAIVQQAVTNGIKHGGAKTVVIVCDPVADGRGGFCLRVAGDDVYKAIKLGAKGYVVKDRDADSILTAVRQVAAGGKYFPKEVMELFRERSMTPDLTAREQEVLALMAKGLSNQEIGEVLSISPESAKIHLKHIFDKLGVTKRVERALVAQRRGFLKEIAI